MSDPGVVARRPRSRYTRVFGRRYILIRPRSLLPAVAIDVLGYALRWLVTLVRRPQQARPVRRVLALRLDHIGDVLITTPALRLLRQAFPDARLDVAAGSWAADLLRDDPDVDRVLVFDAPWYGGAGGLGDAVALIRRLRRERYDVVLDFRGDLRHLLGARLTGAARVYGYGVRGGGFLLSEEVPYAEDAHEVDRALALVRALKPAPGDAGGPQVFLRADDEREAGRLFAEAGVDDRRPVVALCPASRNPTRMWQAAKFAAVARHLVERYRAQVLVFGDSAEAARDVVAAAGPDVRSLLGRTSLRVFAAALERVDVIVSVESSPIHFASALKKPIVTVFGGSSLPEHWGPYGTRHRIVHREVACSPCHQLRCPLSRVLCLEEISADDVKRACDDLFAELDARQPGFKDKLHAAAAMAGLAAPQPSP